MTKLGFWPRGLKLVRRCVWAGMREVSRILSIGSSVSEAVMQDAHVGTWLREAHVSAEIQASVRDLNHRFLDLVVGRPGGWSVQGRGLSAAGSARIAALCAAQKFAALALFFAWHVACTTKLAAQLLLGMHEVTAAAFREATIDCLPSLAETEAGHLTARWNNCTAYWSALTGAASRENPASLRRIQLYGLQLAAAARLCSTDAGDDPKPWERRVELRGVPREV